MPKVKKTFRLSQDTVDELGRIAAERGISMTEAVESAIRNASACTDKEQTEPDAFSAVLETLTEQLHVKDGQIASLTNALEAAQTLHGAQVMPKALETPEKPKRSLRERFFGSW